MYLNLIIITSAENEANFYPVDGFGGLIFFKKVNFYNHTSSWKIGKSQVSCRKLKTDIWICSDKKKHGYNT